MHISSLIRYLSYQLYSATINARKITPTSDIEHLHAFRVSMRKSRSLLRLCVPEAYAMTAILKEIVQKTNELRELDVFLQTLDATRYPELAREIKRFRDERYTIIWSDHTVKKTVKALNRFCDELLELHTDISDKRLIEISQRHFAKSLRLHKKTSKDTSAKELHELRIRFKTSRYALEFLQESGLHEEREKIKACKAIQDHLGAMQDAFNQLQWLEHLCQEHPLKECERLVKERKAALKALKRELFS